MNGTDNPLPSIDRQSLDLLVDGELPEPERRELLLSLDQVPGGWRSCALAFLEAQCWKQTCGTIAREQTPSAALRRTDWQSVLPSATDSQPVVPSGTDAQPVVPSGTDWQSVLPSVVARPRSRLRRFMGSGLTALATAAAFLAALGLGWTLRDALRGGRPPGPGAGEVAGVLPGYVEGNGPQAGRGQTPDTTGRFAVRAVPQPWGTVQVSLPGATEDSRESISVPVTESDHVEGSWFQPSPDTMPAHLQTALERLGYQVRQQRQLLPFPMQGGYRLMLPVDQVELRRVNKPAY